MSDPGERELRAYAASLGKVAKAVIPAADAVLKKAAQNVKTGLRDNLVQSQSFRVAAGSVTYDDVRSFGTIGYEVGPDKDRFAGALANIAFFGTSRGGGTVDFDGPFREELPRLERYMGDLLEDLGGEL